MTACRSCRAVIDGGRFCANCGAPVDDDVPPLALLGDEPRRPVPSPATRSRRGRSTVGTVAIVAAVIAGLVVADRAASGRTEGEAAPTTTTLPSTTPTTAPTTSTTSAFTPTTRPPWPTRVQVPVGGSGEMVLGFSEGTLAVLDLATGDVRALANLDLPQPSSLVVLGDSVWVAGEGAAEPRMRRVSLVDGVVDEDGVPGWPIASGSEGIVVRARPWDQRLEGAFVGTDGHATPFTLPPLHWPAAVVGRRIVVQVPGSIGLYDPESRELVAVADGQFLAANSTGLARTVCAIGGCVVRAGPWDHTDQYELTYDLGESVWGAQLTPDGTGLLFWRPSDGGAASELSVLDLAEGHEVRLKVPPTNGAERPLLTRDGRYAVELRGRYLNFHPLDGGPALQMGQFPESAIAGAMR